LRPSFNILSKYSTEVLDPDFGMRFYIKIEEYDTSHVHTLGYWEMVVVRWLYVTGRGGN